VTLRIGGVECVIRTAIRGPVRIVRDKGDAGPVLAIFDGHRRKMAPLACTHTADWCLLQVLGRADS